MCMSWSYFLFISTTLCLQDLHPGVYRKRVMLDDALKEKQKKQHIASVDWAKTVVLCWLCNNVSKLPDFSCPAIWGCSSRLAPGIPITVGTEKQGHLMEQRRLFEHLPIAIQSELCDPGPLVVAPRLSFGDLENELWRWDCSQSKMNSWAVPLLLQNHVRLLCVLNTDIITQLMLSVNEGVKGWGRSPHFLPCQDFFFFFLNRCFSVLTDCLSLGESHWVAYYLQLLQQLEFFFFFSSP